MAPSIPQHRHCLVCGKAIPAGDEERVCSPACREELEGRRKRQRNVQLLLYGAMAVTVVVLLYSIFR